VAFDAWAFPWSFPLDAGEVESSAVGMGPPLRYPALSPDRIGALLGFLREAGEVLFHFPVNRILLPIDQVARRLLDPADGLRREALESVADHGGYSLPMAREIVNGMARDWTRPALEALLHAEFRHPEVLDGFHPSHSGGEVRVSGYPLAFHLGAGTVPGVSATSLVRSLLVKTPLLLKPGRGDVPLTVLFARALQEADPEMGGAVAVAYWPEDAGGRTSSALGEVDLVVVYGGDETVGWVRDRIPVSTALVAYRHRLGVALVGRGALGVGSGSGGVPASAVAGGGARETALAAARAVALFDQRGCVSPHVFLVEEGGEVDPESWAGLLAGSLEGLEEDLPTGPLTVEEGAVLQQFRGEAEMEESLGRGRVIHGGAEAPWTVHFRREGPLEPSCLNRVVRVIPVADLMEDALPMLGGWRRHLQTVGAAGLGPDRQALLDGLVRLGVSRVVRLAEVPWPPPWWHHDGRGPLRALVRWTDLEGV